MPRVILVTKGSYGDIVPFIALGDALKKRGNSVTLVSHCHYAEVAGRVGLDFDSWDTPTQYERFIDDGSLLDSPTGIPEFCDRHIFPRVDPEYAVIDKYCIDKKVVLVSRHMGSLPAAFISELKNIPHVSVFTAVAQVECLPILREFYCRVLGSRINESRALYGLDPVANWTKWIMDPKCFLACWPEWFAKPSRTWPNNLVNIGFVRSDEAEIGELPPQLSQIDRPVLITGGTAIWRQAARFYETAMKACHLAGRSAILVCRNNELVPRPLAPQVFHFKQLPFATLMPRVAAVIHHGGTSILVRALSEGIPQIAMPFGGDRPDTASRLHNLGACIHIPLVRWSPETVAEKLEEVLASKEVSRACLDLRLNLQTDNMSSLQAGCQSIESLI